jgi:hypothetical protein
VRRKASSLIRTKSRIDEDELLFVPHDAQRVEDSHGAEEVAGVRDAVEGDAGDGA